MLLNQSYQISLIHPIHFKQNFSLFRNTITNLSFPTLNEFRSSKDLEYLDTNPSSESTEVFTFLNIEFLVSIIFSVFITIAIIIVFVKVEIYLSKMKLRKRPKNEKELRNIPVTIEDGILSDIAKNKNKDKVTVTKTNEFNDNSFPESYD